MPAGVRRGEQSLRDRSGTQMPRVPPAGLSAAGRPFPTVQEAARPRCERRLPPASEQVYGRLCGVAHDRDWCRRVVGGRSPCARRLDRDPELDLAQDHARHSGDGHDVDLPVPSAGTFRVTDTAGVIKNPDSGVDLHADQRADARLPLLAVRAACRSGQPDGQAGTGHGRRRARPTRLTLTAPANEIDITGTAFNDILRGSTAQTFSEVATDMTSSSAPPARTPSPAALGRTPSTTTPTTPAASTSRSAVATAMTATPRTGPLAPATR